MNAALSMHAASTRRSAMASAAGARAGAEPREKGAASVRVIARWAGALYFGVIALGVGGEALLRGPIIAEGDAAETAKNVALHAGQFRASIMTDVMMVLSDVALAVLLCVLLRRSGRVLAGVASAFRLVQSAILGLNLMTLVTAAALAAAFAAGGAEATTNDASTIARLINAHAVGYDMGLFFFGVSCVILAVILYRQVRALGVLVGLSGLVYLFGSTVRVLAPEMVTAIEPLYLLPLIGELALAVWLMRGAGIRSAEAG